MDCSATAYAYGKADLLGCATSGSLPATGLDVLVIALVALVIVGGGLYLRRVAR